METMLLCSAKVWPQYGVECDILSTSDAVGSLAPRLAEAGYRIIHLPFRSRRRYLPNLCFLWQFFRLCRVRQYHAIHIHTEAAPPVYALLARFAGVPKVALSVHNTFRFNGILRIRKGLERRVVRILGGRYGMVSDGVADCEREEFKNVGVRIVNWIDTDRFRPPNEEERRVARVALGLPPTAAVLVSVGNCNQAKNHAALIGAVHELSADMEILYLHVGREQEGCPEREMTRQIGVSDKVKFCGPQRDIRTYLWACDLFVMPSLHEGLAIAPLEAIASGCPAILTRVPGLIDLEQAAPHVRFVRPEAEPIATEIRNLLAQPQAIKESDCQKDSMAIRSQFAPARGVQIICEELYGLPAHREGAAA
jgi:glycosyltransferase involved in cell wall biosynthesis